MTGEPSDYDSIWEIMKRISTEMQEAGIPDHEVPPAMADFLIMSVLAMGHANGVSVYTAQTIIQRMEDMVEDWKQGNPPFGEQEEKAVEDRIVQNFITCAAEFVLWSRLARGEVSQSGGEEMMQLGYEKLSQITATVQGNRNDSASFGPADQLAIIDAVCHWHLQERAKIDRS